MAHEEVHQFLQSLIRTVKPEQIATTGVTPEGVRAASEAQRANGAGKTSEIAAGAAPKAKIDMLLCGSAAQEDEIRRLLPQVSPHGLVLLHDRDAALRMQQEGLLSAVLMPTPDPLILAQRREKRG
jgi:hypothetical protein